MLVRTTQHAVKAEYVPMPGDNGTAQGYYEAEVAALIGGAETELRDALGPGGILGRPAVTIVPAGAKLRVTVVVGGMVMAEVADSTTEAGTWPPEDEPVAPPE